MVVLPSIDLLDGKVVRLARGDYGRATVYGEDPVEIASRFVEAGARWIHVVDLNAARSGKRDNAGAVAAICRASGARVELGGGARDEDSIRSMLDGGACRVVVGSAALTDWAWFADLLDRTDLVGRLALGLDGRNGRLAVHGWVDQLDVTAADVARRVSGSGLGCIVFTDIARDGMLSGVNVESTARLVSATDVPIIASGGVGSLADIVSCRDAGCAGAIVGRAYYEGRIDLTQAISEAGIQGF
jgi:phosphoribosylformimino-5-aminoimidazole carboxamide ribotide isomerase